MGENHLTITDGRQTIEYTLGEESLIAVPPENPPAGPPVVVEFDLQWADLDKAVKAMNVLGLQHLAINGAGGHVVLRAVDRKNRAKDHYKIYVGETDKEFETFLDKDNLLVLAKDYRLQVSEGLVRFVNPAVTYWIAAAAPVKE